MSDDRRWVDAVEAAERAFAASDEAARRLETVGAARYLEQVERVRRQVEGPAKQYFETVERARRATGGPAKQYFEMIERAREATEGPTRRLAALLEQARMSIEGPARILQERHAELSRLLSQYDFAAVLERAAAAGEQIEKAFRQSLPVNWRTLSIDDVEKVEMLVREEGVPLVWVPSAGHIAKVVSATTAVDAMTIFLGERDAVLDDLDLTLDEVGDAGLDCLVDKARKSIDALRDGHGDAAQALAAAVFTAALHDGLGHKDLKDVRRAAKANSPDQAGWDAYRGALVVQLASRYVQGRGYELPGFNRSTTLHRVEAAQYTPANNLAAVMAAVSILREAQARCDEGP